MTSPKAGLIVSVCAAAVIAISTLPPGGELDRTSGFCLICGALGTVDAVLNVLLFVPLGFGLGLMRWPAKRAFLACLALTVGIELLQLTIIPMRDATVGDILTNTVGGVTGFILGRSWRTILWPSGKARAYLAAGALVAWTTFAAMTAYSLQPNPMPAPFYGQLARKLSADPEYPGTVLAAHLGAVPIIDEQMTDGEGAIEAVRLGQPTRVSVLPRETTSWLSPIVRIADGHGEELLAVSGIHDQASYRINTRATDLRLRPYNSGIQGVLKPGFETKLDAEFAGGVARLTASGAANRTAVVVYGLSSGWRLFLPLTFISTGSAGERILDLLWVAAWLFPLGYWIAAGYSRSGLPYVALAIATVFCVDLALDYSFALRENTLKESWAPVAAIVLGAIVGRTQRAKPRHE